MSSDFGGKLFLGTGCSGGGFLSVCFVLGCFFGSGVGVFLIVPNRQNKILSEVGLDLSYYHCQKHSF